MYRNNFSLQTAVEVPSTVVSGSSQPWGGNTMLLGVGLIGLDYRCRGVIWGAGGPSSPKEKEKKKKRKKKRKKRKLEKKKKKERREL